MMPSRVLSYLQMGHFLMLVMTLGWAFSTFFFQALCCTIGPQGDWGQFSWSGIFSCCCGKTSDTGPAREERELLRDECEPDEKVLEMNSAGEKSLAVIGVKTTAVWDGTPKLVSIKFKILQQATRNEFFLPRGWGTGNGRSREDPSFPPFLSWSIMSRGAGDNLEEELRYNHFLLHNKHELIGTFQDKI